MKKKDPYNCTFSDTLKSSSAHDCTGLMPTPPRSKAELESYKELSGTATD